MNHTPTPWKVEKKGTQPFTNIGMMIAETHGHRIGTAQDWGPEALQSEQANAEFIVHAVNCTDEIDRELTLLLDDKMMNWDATDARLARRANISQLLEKMRGTKNDGK